MVSLSQSFYSEHENFEGTCAGFRSFLENFQIQDENGQIRSENKLTTEFGWNKVPTEYLQQTVRDEKMFKTVRDIASINNLNIGLAAFFITDLMVAAITVPFLLGAPILLEIVPLIGIPICLWQNGRLQHSLKKHFLTNSIVFFKSNKRMYFPFGDKIIRIKVGKGDQKTTEMVAVMDHRWISPALQQQGLIQYPQVITTVVQVQVQQPMPQQVIQQTYQPQQFPQPQYQQPQQFPQQPQQYPQQIVYQQPQQQQPQQFPQQPQQYPQQPVIYTQSSPKPLPPSKPQPIPVVVQPGLSCASCGTANSGGKFCAGCGGQFY